MNSINILTSERLLLRPLLVTDLDMYANLLGDKDVTFHIGGPKTYEEMSQKVIKDAATWPEYGYGRFIVELKDSQKPIGMCGVWKSTIDSFHFDEVGYAIFKDHWGNGYTTEAISTLVHFAHNIAKLNLLYAIVSAENKASKKVLVKNDFQFERLIDRLQFKNAELWRKDNTF